MKDIIVIDDVISKSYQDWIESTFTTNRFPWFFDDQISVKNSDDSNTGFSHVIFNGEYIGPQHDMTLPILLESVERGLSTEVKDLYRIRLGLFFKNQNEQVHKKHVDLDIDHYVMLYYVNDSDGPTYIWGDSLHEVQPKKGRCVIFPGSLYHSSSSPKIHPKRIVINYNFLPFNEPSPSPTE